MSELHSNPSFKLLARGDYQSLVETAIDQAERAPSLDDMPWVIGALSFLGRSAEAQGLYSQNMKQLSNLGRGAARFFLAVSLCREGQFERSRSMFVEAIRDSRLVNDPIQNFFAFQGLAFYRYSTGRLERSRSAAESALQNASAASFVYGKVLALELLGHIQLSMGQFYNGFRSFDLARDRALALGQGAVLQAIEVSGILYRASYGIGKSSSELLELLHSSLSHEYFADSYTQVALNLELARLLILRGELARAKEQLESSSALVYAIDNPDLEMDYNLQLAALLRCRGELHQSLSIIRAAKFRVEKGQDLKAKLKVLGFELQILKALGRVPEHEAGIIELNRLSRLSGSLMARRYMHRHRYEILPDIRQGEDALGDLIDRVASFRDTVVPDILRTEWFGLLPAALNIPASDRVLYFDAELGSLSIFNQGDVEHLREGCSTLIRKLLILLAEAPASKEELANKLWQQSYNPLRHDGLIYALVAKTRKMLGHAGAWLEAYELGYRLRDGVRIASPYAEKVENESQVQTTPASSAGEVILDRLHPRQKMIMSLMREEGSIEPRELVKRLGVSDATVSRDMSYLIDVGCAERVGRGRAIRYVINESKN